MRKYLALTLGDQLVNLFCDKPLIVRTTTFNENNVKLIQLEKFVP